MTLLRITAYYLLFLLALYWMWVPLRVWRVERASQTLRLPDFEVTRATLDKRFTQLTHHAYTTRNMSRVALLREAHQTLTFYYTTGS